MTPEARQKLKSLLVAHKEYKQFPCPDPTGHLVIGIGRNLTERGVSTVEAFYLLDEDINYYYHRLNHFLKFFSELNEARQVALVNMCFNLGVQGFLGFKDMILALEAGDYERAAYEILDSKWATQVGELAFVLADIVRRGEM